MTGWALDSGGFTELGLRLHGFGVKAKGFERYAHALASADSLSWSLQARKNAPLPECTHARCSNCPRFAVRWWQRQQDRIAAAVREPRLF